MAEPILTTKELKKRFGTIEAVKGVSFSVLPGEIFSLLGPNGAGKTTIISMLSCLLVPSEGDAWVAGHSIRSNAMAVKHLIGIVPQDLALYEALTARQNLHFWGQMYGLGGKELKRRADQALERVSLSDRQNDRVSSFSGGMKRRLNIAVGLLHSPRLVFMDEPTVGIDPQSRRSILETVKELRAQGMTVIYTTHYMEEAEELSNRVGIIDHGRLIALGTQKELTRLVGEQVTLRLHLADDRPAEPLAPLFKEVNGVILSSGIDSQLVLSVVDAGQVLPGVVLAAHEAGVPVRSIDIDEPNLESVFLHLTGRALRDSSN